MMMRRIATSRVYVRTVLVCSMRIPIPYMQPVCANYVLICCDICNMYRYVSRASASSVIITKQMQIYAIAHTSAVSHGSYAHRTFLRPPHPPIALILLISFFLAHSSLHTYNLNPHITSQLRIPLALPFSKRRSVL